MEEMISLVKDFTTLQTELRLTMPPLQQMVNKHDSELTALTDKFNELRDAFEEYQKSAKKGKE